MPYGYGYFGFNYVSVAEKRRKALRKIEELRKKNKDIKPIEPFTDRKIAHSFWGQSWCDNMERYADYENRLPRGRSYIRHGCICDLQIGEGLVTALVNGSSLYRVRVEIDRLTDERAELLQNLLRGKISSQLELLQGKIPKDVRELVGNPDNGIIPFPKEIHTHCSCPDSASLCKHIAAVLYGIGRRLDTEPGVLFTLRGLDPNLLCASPDSLDLSVGDSEENLSGDEDLGAMFGIDLGSIDDVDVSAVLGDDSPQGLSDGAVVDADTGPAPSVKATSKRTTAKAAAAKTATAKKSSKKASEKPVEKPAGKSGKKVAEKAAKPAKKAATRKVEEAADAPVVSAGAAPETGAAGEGKAASATGGKAAKASGEKTSSTRKKTDAKTKGRTLETPAPEAPATESAKAVVTEAVKEADAALGAKPGRKAASGKAPARAKETAKGAAAKAEVAESPKDAGATSRGAEQAVGGTAAKAAGPAAGTEATGPFDAAKPTAEGLLALCELAGHTPQEVSYLMGVGFQTFKSWLAQKGPLSLKSGSLSKIEKYQRKVLRARAKAGK